MSQVAWKVGFTSELVRSQVVRRIAARTSASLSYDPNDDTNSILIYSPYLETNQDVIEFIRAIPEVGTTQTFIVSKVRNHQIVLEPSAVRETPGLFTPKGRHRCLEYKSTKAAYDAIQTGEVSNSDYVVIESERVVGLPYTWPVAITIESGELHYVDTDSEGVVHGIIKDAGWDVSHIKAAYDEATRLGYEVRSWVPAYLKAEGALK